MQRGRVRVVAAKLLVFEAWSNSDQTQSRLCLSSSALISQPTPLLHLVSFCSSLSNASRLPTSFNPSVSVAMCIQEGSLEYSTSTCKMCAVMKEVYRKPFAVCPHKTKMQFCRRGENHPRGGSIVHYTNAQISTFNGCGYCKVRAAQHHSFSLFLFYTLDPHVENLMLTDADNIYSVGQFPS